MNTPPEQRVQDFLNEWIKSQGTLDSLLGVYVYGEAPHRLTVSDLQAVLSSLEVVRAQRDAVSKQADAYREALTGIHTILKDGKVGSTSIDYIEMIIASVLEIPESTDMAEREVKLDPAPWQHSYGTGSNTWPSGYRTCRWCTPTFAPREGYSQRREDYA